MIKPCDHCGKEFKTKPSRIETGRGKYCSKDCAFANVPTGENHGNWKGGIVKPYFNSKEEKAAYMKKWNAAHPEQTYKYRRNRWDRYKKAIYETLGNTCRRCGFSDQRALQVDHINGGGYKHRKELHGGQVAFYKCVLESPAEYQILCANCNWIKRYENKEGTGLGSQPGEK